MPQPTRRHGTPERARAHDDDLGWPATEVRDISWTTNPDQRGPNGRRPNQQDRMFTNAQSEVPPRIAELPVRLPDALAGRCALVEQDIADLDSEYGSHLSGLTSFLVRSESVATSRIEHLNADMDDFARASLQEEASREAKQMAAAAQAITLLVENQRPGLQFTQTELLAAHRALLEGDPLEGNYAGRYRDAQNWLGGSDFSPRGAVHVPPPPGEVAPLMADLTEFVNRTDMPPLAQAALTHGQFEAIHPFTDGNGRTGRALIAAVLRRRGVTERVSVPIASAMLADVDSYFDALVAYRNGEAHTLVDYLAGAADVATRESKVSAERLSRLPAQWMEQVRPRKGSSAHTLIVGLLDEPVLNASAAQRLTGSSTPRTYEALDRLVEAEVLHEITGQSRNRVWTVSDVATELADLDVRIGARTKPSRRWR